MPTLSNIPQIIGTTRVYKLPVASASLDPITGQPLPWPTNPWPWLGTETFAATLSLGAGYGAIVTLTPPTWLGDPTVTGVNPVVLLEVKASDTAMLPSAGDFLIEVILNPGTDDRLLFSGTIRVELGVGSTPAPFTYATVQDMVDLMSWIENVADLGAGLGGGSGTNFTSYLVQASNWLRLQAYARARKNLLYQIRIQGPQLAGLISGAASGYDSGPYFGPSNYPDPLLESQLTEINTLVNTPGVLMVDSQDFGQTRRMVAAYAIYLACRHLRGSTGPKDEDGVSYRAIALDFKREAFRMLSGWVCRLDVNADGVAEFELRA